MTEAEVQNLKAARDSAWSRFDPHWQSSKENDWPTFALANADWLAAYRKVYGIAPEPDEIDRLATHWYNNVRKSSKNTNQADTAYVPRSDEQRSKVNEYRRQHRAPLVNKMLPQRESETAVSEEVGDGAGEDEYAF
jgi:uncharacterized protein (UPF0297 family)